MERKETMIEGIHYPSEAEALAVMPDYDHELKVWPAYFHPICEGVKTFEVRRDDRGFQRGQILRLREWDERCGLNEESRYTGNEEYVRIEWILTGGQMGIEPGYVVMAIKRLNEDA
jgi:hypothetical protein